MNEIDINKETALLDELAELKPQKGKLFNALIVASVFYMGFILVDYNINLDTLKTKTFDWQLALLALTLPFSGLIFYCNSKRIGWVLNAFYYFFIASLSLYTYIKMLFLENMAFLDRTNWRGVLILSLATSCSAILSSGSIRKYFRVNIAVLITLLFISVALAMAAASVVVD